MDAFEEFETKSFVSRLLGKGDVKGLQRKLEEAMPEAKQQELMETMAKGNMTLRSFRKFIEQIGSMGSMSSVRPCATSFSVCCRVACARLRRCDSLQRACVRAGLRWRVGGEGEASAVVRLRGEEGSADV